MNKNVGDNGQKVWNLTIKQRKSGITGHTLSIYYHHVLSYTQDVNIFRQS